jgi:hypothetical protein
MIMYFSLQFLGHELCEPFCHPFLICIDFGILVARLDLGSGNGSVSNLGKLSLNAMYAEAMARWP